jgi:hypothetical protein
MPIHGFPGGVISSTAVTPSVSSASGVWTLDEQLQAGANWPVAPAFLNNSVRTRSSATAYMSRTPATSGNRKTWTFSAWVKRGGATFNTQSTILHAYDGSAGQRGEIYFDSSNRINFFRGSASGTTEGAIYTNAVFRDPASWYHIVVVADFTNPTVANRGLIYVNGVLQSVTTVNSFASTDGQINGNWAHQIAIQGTSSNPFDGYIADVNFIDGQALTPNYFGAVDAATGVWEPATYRGSYGTNGFYLPMNVEAAEYGIEYFVLGGGSGGSRGAAAGGGGGAGGYTTSSTTNVIAGSSVPVVVGGGGAGATAQTTNGSAGGASSITVLSTTITANGGTNTVASGNLNGYAGLNGGSGGGSGANSPAGVGGTDGGDGGAGTYGAGLGQGSTTRAFGGTLYAGGGGGGGGSASWVPSTTGAAGGAGGGAAGANDSATGNSASANTGGGGGGGGGNASITGANGGGGGSGIVIIRYLGAQRGTGGTVTSAGGYTIHTFTSSGTYTA